MTRSMRRGEFIFGLGIGLLIASSLAMVSPVFPSRSQVEAAAREIGMVFPEEVSMAATKTNTTSTETDTKAGTTSPDGEFVKITIPKGMVLEDVISMLAEKGVLSDQEEALALAQEMNLSTRVVAGTYTLPLGEEVKTVLQAISD